MTTQEYLYRKVPDYYDTMYLDGFTPDEIMYAHRRMVRRKMAEQQKQIDELNNNTYKVKITSEVKIKK